MKHVLVSLLLLALACDGAQGNEPGKGNNPNKVNSTATPTPPSPTANGGAGLPVPQKLPGFDLSLLSPGPRRAFLDAINAGLSPCDRPETIASCISNNPGCLDCSYVARTAFRLARDQELDAESLSAHMEMIKEGLTASPRTFDLTNVPMRGNPEASVVVVEFADFQCPVCAIMHEELERLLPQMEPKIQFYFKNFPIVSKHPLAEPAARAALAAGKQGKFWEYHNILFKRQEQLSEENFVAWAGELGLDVERFKADYSSKELADQVARDRKDAEAAGVGGTPSIFIDGRPFNDQRSAEALKDAIEHALAKKAQK